MLSMSINEAMQKIAVIANKNKEILEIFFGFSGSFLCGDETGDSRLSVNLGDRVGEFEMSL